jgi:hypothetical protein
MSVRSGVTLSVVLPARSQANFTVTRDTTLPQVSPRTSGPAATAIAESHREQNLSVDNNRSATIGCQEQSRAHGLTSNSCFMALVKMSSTSGATFVARALVS